MADLSAGIVNLIESSLGDFRAMGGPGSGHWGHRGRKGKRGGSAPSRAGRLTPLADLVSPTGFTDIGGMIGRLGEEGTKEEITGRLFAEIGYNSLPSVVTEKELDSVIGSGGLEMFRAEGGARAAEYAEQFRSGRLHTGSGFYASGVHAAHGRDAESHAKHFAKSEGGVVTRMALSKGAKVVTEAEVHRLHDQFSKLRDTELNKLSVRLAKDPTNKDLVRDITEYSRISNDVAEFARHDMARLPALLGYDAIQGLDGQGLPETIILNRGKVYVSDTSTTVPRE